MLALSIDFMTLIDTAGLLPRYLTVAKHTNRLGEAPADSRGGGGGGGWRGLCDLGLSRRPEKINGRLPESWWARDPIGFCVLARR